MKIIHILLDCNVGGIEVLCKNYTQYSKHDNIVVLLWGDGELADEIKRNGIKVINLWESKKNIFSTLNKVVEICRSECADVLVAHHAAPMLHLCLLYSKMRLKKIAAIAYAHGNAVDMVRTKDKKGLFARRKILQCSLKKANTVVAISNSVKNSLINYFHTPEQNIKVIYNGVDLKQFKQLSNRKTNGTVELIYVGRLVRDKGVQVILEGLSKVSCKEKFHMSIVGDGAYRSELETLANQLGISGMVEFCGSRRDIPERLNQADYFIHMPVWEEGFGITIIEAMAAGLICICADSGAVPEIITDKVNGFIVKKDDPISLAYALERVTSMTEEERDRIRKAAVERAKDFSIENYTKQLDDCISTVAGM